MLILARFRDEKIMIGDDIVVTVVDIRGGKVVLGVAAPRSIHVDREEIRRRIEREGPDGPDVDPDRAA